MHLTHLLLRNFRNYREQAFSFHPHFNLIVGKNAQGKTNLLEAIYYLGFLNSFKGSKKSEMVGPLGEGALIQAGVEREDLADDISIQIYADRRQVEVNGKKPDLFGHYYGSYPVLLFEPEDVYLFRRSPTTRRKYLNRAVFLFEPSLLKILRDYEKVVAQKNFLLKGSTFFSEGELEIWNEKLAELGSKIINLRLEWIRLLEPLLLEEYKQIAGRTEEIRLIYKTSLELQLPGSASYSSDSGTIAQILLHEINKKSRAERERRETLVGPHRDDWQIVLNGKLLGDYGSQGENRSLVIALKSAQSRLFKEKRKMSPIFLLDDVASELDEERIDHLFSRLSDILSQVFLTTAKTTGLERYLQGVGTSFMVEQGEAHVIENKSL